MSATEPVDFPDDEIAQVEISAEVVTHKFVDLVPGSTMADRADRRTKAALLKARFETDDQLSVHVENLNPEDADMFWTTETVERFLVGSDMKEKKAEELLLKSHKWRAEYKPFSITYEDVKECMNAGSVFICGKCKAGRPVFYLSPGAVNAFPAEKRIQLIVYLAEESFRRGYQQLTWIFDFGRLGENKGKDPEAKKTRKAMMSVLQDNYPERLGALHLVNTPWFISAVATVVWPFMNARTKAKINLKCTKEELLKYVDKEQLIESLGGLKQRSAKPFPDCNEKCAAPAPPASTSLSTEANS
eukprot:GILI01015641.1.p1 GENE.GILI01015641.1~~GILI01015641.1.p1  ORF type:complete len:302 (-),score=70.74 GILI01015641.1:113-1018(-)